MSGVVPSPAARPTLLELDGLVRRYRTRGSLLGAGAREVVALNHLSLAIGRGEVFGLVGESGSGKTTAGRLIVRLEEPDAGCIRLAGEDVARLRGAALKAFRRRVQMIFQDPYQSLNPQLSVFDTVAEPLVIHRLARGDELVEAVWQALQRAGLTPPEEFAWRYPHRLSGGQRQRVAIARAMVLEPDLLVADEPTSMLDASISAQIFNILHRVRDRFGVTILFITHNLAAARYLCDRIGVIYRGNLMEVGPAHAVIHDPRHPYTKALIDALPKFGQGAAFRRFDTLRSVERDALESVGCPFFARCRVAHPVRCGREVPPLDDVAPGHRAACFYASEPQPEASSAASGGPPPE